MTKSLIIAEKPSVAQDIVRALTPSSGKFEKQAEHFENDHYVVTSAVGHLVEITAPEEYDVKRGKWSFAHLPVVPPHFDLAPIDKNKTRLNAVVKLVKRKDVTELINACDAGREGELIFRLIVQYAGSAKAPIHKPIQRLWLQSMTPQAIRDGFERLRSDAQMHGLADAARSRSEADWLVGINGTRAMTAFNSRDGGFFLTTVGRVQTPTLSIVVEREEKIRKHVARDYWEIKASFGAAAGAYDGKWFDPKFKKGDDADARADRLWNEADANKIADAVRGKTGTVSEEAKPSSQSSPLLYDLTTLQREANSRFGFSAKTTLSLAQALYEKHKALTYPRTDSRALPEDYLGTVKKALDTFAAQKTSGYARHAAQILRNGWVKPNRRVFDNKKISDHFAIIPTMQLPRHLSEAEKKLYDLVVKRFLAVFFPAAEYLVTTRLTRVEGEAFKTEGRVMTQAGWLEVYGKEAETGESSSLVAIKTGEKVRAREVEVRASQTKPPARFTEATLLSAMEGAGKLVEDEELREAMSEKGLGTPATRAQIIEGLIYEDYVHRSGRELQPTPKASSLLFALRHFGVNELCSPELTGNWEFKLKQMEHGTLPRSEFMEHIVDLTREMVSRIKRGVIPDTVFRTLKTPCPKCGGTVQENYRKFKCQKCDFSIWKVVSSREFAPEEIETLIAKRSVGPLTGFRSRVGKPFAAMVRLTPELRAEFDFGRQAGDDAAEKVDFSGLTPLGPCPKCGGRVFEQPMAYVCENSVHPTRRCDFRSGRVILQRPVEPDELPPGLDVVAHQLCEDLIRGDPVFDLHFEQPPRLRIHRSLPELFRIHLSEALVALDRRAALDFSEQPLHGLRKIGNPFFLVLALDHGTRPDEALQ